MAGSIVHIRLEICSVSHSNRICLVHFGDARLMTLTIHQKIVEIASDSLSVNIYRYFFIAQKGNGCLGRCARLHRTLHNCTGRPEQEDEESKNSRLYSARNSKWITTIWELPRTCFYLSNICNGSREFIWIKRGDTRDIRSWLVFPFPKSL